MNEYLECSAVISEDGIYRYSLKRIWDSKKPKVMFIGLNPSTADGSEDDPTIRRCVSFAKYWGYGGLEMTNLFAYRATDPNKLKFANDPVGIFNDSEIRSLMEQCGITVACWGVRGVLNNRNEEVMRMFEHLYCLRLTKHGHPWHPLYLKGNLTPILF